jgi:putative aldouronate transport system substrate-binding protein
LVRYYQLCSLLGGEPEDDIITPYLTEGLRKYGIELNYELVYLERTQYSELLNLLLASGDAPDVFYSNSSITQAEYYKQGLVKSWDEDFFREHAPNVAAIFDDGGPNGMTKGLEYRTWALTKAADGKMITIPIIYFEQNIMPDIMYNGLWIEALDAKIPTTLEEFETLMYRFVNDDPDGNGKKDTYAFSNTMFNAIYGAFGSLPNQWKEEEDGSLVYGAVLDSTREGLEKLAHYYKEGLIDPEFITGENEGGSWAISHALANGQIGVTNISGYHKYASAEEFAEVAPNANKPDGAELAEVKKVQGNEAYILPGPAFTGPRGDAGVAMNAAASSPNTLYNASMDDEKLAICLKIMDAFAQDTELAIAARYGLPNEDWEIIEEGGTSSLILYTSISEASPKGGSAMRNLYGPGDVLNNEYYRLIGNANPEIAIVTKIRSTGENMRKGYVDPVFAPFESISQYKADLDTYQNELFTKIIRGEASIDEFDGFVSYWYENGGQQMIDDVNNWYKNIKK